MYIYIHNIQYSVYIYNYINYIIIHVICSIQYL